MFVKNPNPQYFSEFKTPSSHTNTYQVTLTMLKINYSTDLKKNKIPEQKLGILRKIFFSKPVYYTKKKNIIHEIIC